MLANTRRREVVRLADGTQVRLFSALKAQYACATPFKLWHMVKAPADAPSGVNDEYLMIDPLTAGLLFDKPFTVRVDDSRDVQGLIFDTSG